jgi:hypothetical protein
MLLLFITDFLLQANINEPLLLADFIIFSFNRPMQLDALLRSTKKYVVGIGNTIVLYRTSNENYQHAYEIVKNDFPEVIFLKQGIKPAQDFKQLTLSAIFNYPSPYVLFGVDDIIVKDYTNLHDCIQLMETNTAYGFFLRLGLHLSCCYPLENRPQPIPPYQEETEDVISWQFSSGLYDWRYPHTLDMTLYRKQDIKMDFESMHYIAPNPLEGEWHSRAAKIMHRRGLCFKRSKIVNIPMNLVQTIWTGSINMGTLSPSYLLDLFSKGKRIDFEALFQINNPSAHINYEPSFLEEN